MVKGGDISVYIYIYIYILSEGGVGVCLTTLRQYNNSCWILGGLLGLFNYLIKFYGGNRYMGGTIREDQSIS